ncbi:hypothetical protein F5884DRAFT_195349 [Xylogone sp. PMI_703]|nr:hypothetical protein F5884DRAFT_195349 [Xylogone sp. PMI_703]
MSSDLLAEFDNFYKSQGAQQIPANTQNQQGGSQSPASNGQSLLGGGFEQWPTSQPAVKQDVWGAMSSLQGAPSTPQPQAVQDDIWGSFEAAPSAPSHSVSINPPSSTTNPSLYGQSIKKEPQIYSDDPKPEVIRRPTLEMFSASGSISGPSKASSSRIPPQRSATAGSSSLGDVLFDATEEGVEEDDDEFGEFEDASPPPRPQPQPQPVPQPLDDLFGDLTMSPVSTRSSNEFFKTPVTSSPANPPVVSSLNKMSSRGTSSNNMPTNTEYKKPTDLYENRQGFESNSSHLVELPKRSRITDNDWSDFTVSRSEAPAIESAMASDDDDDAWNWDGAWAVNNTTQAKPTSTTSRPSDPPPISTISSKTPEPPPTNIPPPSVLLSLFGSLFDLPHSKLFKAVSNQPISLKNRIMADPSTIDFLRGYLLLATVAARILAGRKFRWKRDTFLSQAMKIGPASAAGKGGMKLTGVDKAEATREDRETADVVRIWKEQLGRLKSAVATANSSIQDPSKHLTIPDINEVMHVKGQAGALTAPKPCLICGLKREERIEKVDVAVEDSFGEWWTEHWGHRACKNFWLEHEQKLKHR